MLSVSGAASVLRVRVSGGVLGETEGAVILPEEGTAQGFAGLPCT